MSYPSGWSHTMNLAVHMRYTLRVIHVCMDDTPHLHHPSGRRVSRGSQVGPPVVDGLTKRYLTTLDL